MLKLTLFIDGVATKLLQPLVSQKTGNLYWNGSKKAVRFGTVVDGSVLTNGRNSVFTIGMAEWTGEKDATGHEIVNPDGAPITIPLVQDADKATRSEGEITITVPSHGEKLAEVSVNDLGDGRFTVKAGVRGKSGGGARKAAASSDIFA